MPIFNLDGIRRFETWSLSEEADVCYNANGDCLLNNSVLSISDIPSYYQQPVQNMMEEIASLSADWQNFIFLTDTHEDYNENHSQIIAMYMAENLQNIDFICLGGDYSEGDWARNEYETYTNPFLMRKIAYKTHAIIGNHERFGSGSYAESRPLIARDFCKPKTGISGNTDYAYYYFDNTVKKTRYMLLNTSGQSNLTMDSTQLSWIASNVVLPGTDWHLVVIAHVNVDDLGGITTGNEANAQSIIDAINLCNGNIVGFFCGHQHIDDTRNIGDFQQTILLCDKIDTLNYYPGLSFPNRTSGTTTEQAITIVSINTIAKRVVCRRIGAGWQSIIENLQYTY